MRVLQVCSASTLGGGEVHVIELVDALRQSGHHVMVAGRSHSPLRTDIELPFLNALDLYTCVRLRAFIAGQSFDIVHAHLARDYPIVALALTGRRRPRLVLTRQLLHRIRPNPLLSRADGWIVTTEQIRRSIEHLDPGSSVVIPNWVDASRFPFLNAPLRTPVTVGLLGQISPHKGHDDALAAIRELGSGFRLLIGGAGEPAYVRGLEARAEGLPVDFLGFVDSRQFMERIDILILPSWEEPFGIVVLEAMSSGVNVVATAAGGPPEILDHGEAGLLVPPRNPPALARAIELLVSDEELRIRLRAAARSRVLERYEIGRIVPQIDRYYRRLG